MAIVSLHFVSPFPVRLSKQEVENSDVIQSSNPDQSSVSQSSVFEYPTFNLVHRCTGVEIGAWSVNGLIAGNKWKIPRKLSSMIFIVHGGRHKYCTAGDQGR
jgi:hypothetical protein